MWLKFNDLERASVVFIENEISGKELFQITDADLVPIIPQIGIRKRIVRAIGALEGGSGGGGGSVRSADELSNTGSDDGSARSGTSKSSMSRGGPKPVFRCVQAGTEMTLRLPEPLTLANVRDRLRSEYGTNLTLRYADSDVRARRLCFFPALLFRLVRACSVRACVRACCAMRAHACVGWWFFF